MTRKPALAVTRVLFDPDVIASALKITPDQAVAALRDGRGAWPLSELWGARLYDFLKHGNTNQPVSDGAVALGQLGDVNVSVKALTSSEIKFQQSKFVGIGRSTDKAGLIASIEACDRIIVVDITGFPEVRFLPIDGARLAGAAHTGRLTAAGWSKPRLQAWIEQVYDVSETSLEL